MTLRTLRGNVLWTLAGRGFFAACQWALLVVLARVGSSAEVGVFVLALAVCNPVMVFSQLSLRPLLATDIKLASRFTDYFALRALTSLIGCILIVGITVFWDFASSVRWVIIAVAFLKTCDNLSDITYGQFQQRNRHDLMAKSLILRGSLGLVLLGVSYCLLGRLDVSVVIMSVGWLLVFGTFDLPATSDPSTQRRPENGASFATTAWRLVLMGLPLAVGATLVSLNTNIPRYYVDAHAGSAALGVFAAMAYFVVLGNMIVNSVAQAVAPTLAWSYNDAGPLAFRHLIVRLVLGATILGLLGVVAALVVGPAVLRLVYGPEFAVDAWIFGVIMCAGLLSYVCTFLSYALITMRHLRIQPAFFAASCSVSALACYLLVPRFGLAGAAVAWTASMLVQLLLTGSYLSVKLRSLSARTL